MKFVGLFLCLLVCFSCASHQDETIPFNPDYNRYAQNVTVVKQSSLYVTYEYKNIRVDEIAALAAQYCQEHDGKRASLYDVLLHQNNSRRATFVCKKDSVN